MPDHEVSVYDHEIEDGPRRRAVADWGVGEELFDRMPSRRRFRPSEGGAARRDVHAGEVGAPRRDVHAGEAPRHSRERDSHADSRERESHADDAARQPRERRFEGAGIVDAAPVQDMERTTAPGLPDAAPPELETPAQRTEGRRTVVIRGRGSEPAAMPRRSRPPRTAGERIGPRPDRVAAWAVALGMLLILIAILTAH